MREGRFRLGWLAAVATAACALVTTLASRGHAERFDPLRPHTLHAGPVAALAPCARVDGARSGVSPRSLPRGALRVAWRKKPSVMLEQPPLVTSRGEVVLASTRGELVAFEADGNDAWRSPPVGASAGPAVVLGDDTVAFVSAGGEVVGVRQGAFAFRARVGPDRAISAKAAPLPTDDGGFVAAFGAELLLVGADGAVRSRGMLPESAATPLVRAPDAVLAIGATGVVHAWSPGREPTRIGRFAAGIDGSAALSEGHLLHAVVRGELAVLDLRRGGQATTRAAVPGELLLGPPALHRGEATLFAHSPSTDAVVRFAGANELFRITVATAAAASLADGGAAPLAAPAHTGVLVDADGATAFATPTGDIGVIDADGAVSMLEGVVCSAGGGPRLVAVGLVPADTGAFYVACEFGALFRITGAR